MNREELIEKYVRKMIPDNWSPIQSEYYDVLTDLLNEYDSHFDSFDDSDVNESLTKEDYIEERHMLEMAFDDLNMEFYKTFPPKYEPGNVFIRSDRRRILSSNQNSMIELTIDTIDINENGTYEYHITGKNDQGEETTYHKDEDGFERFLLKYNFIKS